MLARGQKAIPSHFPKDVFLKYVFATCNQPEIGGLAEKIVGRG